MQFVGNALYGQVGMNQHPAGFGIEQACNEVAGRFVGDLAYDARQVSRGNGELAGVELNAVLFFVVLNEE